MAQKKDDDEDKKKSDKKSVADRLTDKKESGSDFRGPPKDGLDDIPKDTSKEDAADAPQSSVGEDDSPGVMQRVSDTWRDNLRKSGMYGDMDRTVVDNKKAAANIPFLSEDSRSRIRGDLTSPLTEGGFVGPPSGLRPDDTGDDPPPPNQRRRRPPPPTLWNSRRRTQTQWRRSFRCRRRDRLRMLQVSAT